MAPSSMEATSKAVAKANGEHRRRQFVVGETFSDHQMPQSSSYYFAFARSDSALDSSKSCPKRRPRNHHNLHLTFLVAPSPSLPSSKRALRPTTENSPGPVVLDPKGPIQRRTHAQLLPRYVCIGGRYTIVEAVVHGTWTHTIHSCVY